MKKKCLILGGGGFIGANLVGELLRSGYGVRVFDVNGFPRNNIAEYVNDIEIIEGDFVDIDRLQLALKDVDYVYHLISSIIPSSSPSDLCSDIESNVISTLKLLQLIERKPVKKIIFLSSGGTVYGIPNKLPIKEDHSTNPINSYGITKKTIEDYLKLFNKLTNIDVCIFRLSNPYGKKQNPRGIQGVIPVFLYKAINNEAIEVWGDGSVVRDYIHIKDVSQILVKALDIETPEIVYNLGSGIGTSINEILTYIKENLEPGLNVNYTLGRSFDVPINVLDVSALRNRFGFYQPINVQEGIKKLHLHLKGF